MQCCHVAVRMRVIGELPSLSVAVSDSRLCDILSLVASIPLPQAAPPPAADEDEDLHLVAAMDCISYNIIRYNNVTEATDVLIEPSLTVVCVTSSALSPVFLCRKVLCHHRPIKTRTCTW